MDDFDPRNVERWWIITRCPEPFTAPIEPFTEVVAAADYDKLLQAHIQTLINFNACTLKLAAMKG